MAKKSKMLAPKYYKEKEEIPKPKKVGTSVKHGYKAHKNPAHKKMLKKHFGE